MSILAYSLLPPPFGTSDAPTVAQQEASASLRFYTDLALDPITWDILTPLQLVRGPAAVAQRLTIRLRMWYREWFLDQRVGMQWAERVFVVNPSIRTIRRLITSVMLNTPGVARVDDMRIVFDRRERLVTIDNFKIVLTDGSALISKPDQPFIVGGKS